MKVRKTTGNLSTATGTQTIAYPSGIGDPVALELHVFTNTDLTRLGNSCGSVVAFHDGTNTVSAFSFYAGNPSTQGEAQRGASSTRIYMQSGTPTTLIDMTISINTGTGNIELSDTSGTAPADTYEYLLITYHGTDVNALAVRHNGADQTESLGFDWTFLRTAGPSTSSDSTTNGANNIGACDTSASQACIRHGQQDGGTSFFAHQTNDAINQNVFLGSTFEDLKVDTITATGFNLNVSTGNEEGIYLAIGCDNSAEVLTNQTVSATGTTALTTTIEPEFVFMAGAVDMAAINTTYNAASGANFWMGCADLSGGVGVSGDYFGYRFSFNRDGGVATECQISHTYCVFGVDADTTGGATIEEAEGDISAVTGTSLTLDMDLCDSTARFWVLVIGPEPGGAAKELAGVVTGSSEASLEPSSPWALAGVASGSGAASGSLDRTTYLAGVVQAAATPLAALDRTTYLSGIAAGSSDASADQLLGSGQLDAVATGSSQAIGALSRTAYLAGVAAGSSQVIADLSKTVIPLAGVVTGSSQALADLSQSWPLAGVAAGSSEAIADVTPTRYLAGVAAGSSDLSATMTRSILISGVAAGSSQVVANMTATAPGNTDITIYTFGPGIDAGLTDPKFGAVAAGAFYFGDLYQLRGDEGHLTKLVMAVIPKHAQVVAMTLAHDAIGNFTVDIGTEDDPDAYLAGGDVSASGVLVANTFGAGARPIGADSYRIMITLNGAGQAVSTGANIQLRGVAVLPGLETPADKRFQ